MKLLGATRGVFYPATHRSEATAQDAPLLFICNKLTVSFRVLIRISAHAKCLNLF